MATPRILRNKIILALEKTKKSYIPLPYRKLDITLLQQSTRFYPLKAMTFLMASIYSIRRKI